MLCPDLAAVLPVADGGGLALVLGAYGAIVSTLLAALQLLRDRPGVKLRVTPTNVFLELDFRRDRDQMGAYVVDDLDRDFPGLLAVVLALLRRAYVALPRGNRPAYMRALESPRKWRRINLSPRSGRSCANGASAGA